MVKGIGKTELESILASNPRMVGSLRGTNMSGFLSKTELEGLVTGSVQTADIADLAVATGKIANLAVEEGKLAANAVINVKVAAGAAIVPSKLAAGGVRATIIGGGAAGAHVVTGIAVGDNLVAVLQIDATDVSETYADLTAEFTISDTDEIDNAGGTDTTGCGLVVVYEDRTP